MPTTPDSGPGGPSRRRASGGRRRPGPRRRLSLELIVDTAIELVEARGLSALSMRSLAERLGTAPGTLYTYVANRSALEALILDAVVARDGLPHELPGTWLEKLETWARKDWVTFREKPWVMELRRANPDFGPASVIWLDSALRVFDGTELPAQVKLDMIDALDAYVLGAATVDVQSNGRAPGPSPELSGKLDEAQLKVPTLFQALSTGATPFSASGFEFGLHCLLAGFRAIAEETRDAPPQAP
ncbi:TetR/AcrR family transcriptional regulator [Nocardiopsis ganjiahuensis]|uniref:TetR/AcrR family transcriptional regulator n=1 Tax=Nocardiopsis ganjiahuensis TaxID=239984 RepID=UPI000348D1A8|nr:TetR/AcrR family transcriptional regulator C-terminal domain-containing protein [Nocardiopsis ganjiahuensis]